MSKKEDKKEKKDNKPKTNSKENKKRLKELERQAKANESNYEMTRLFKILGGVLIALVLFYVIFAYFHGELFKKKTKTEETVQNVEIMAGTAFSKQTGTYYVLFYDFEGNYKELINKVYTAFQRKDSDTKIYKVNLGSTLNKSYVASTSEEVNTSSNKDLKVIDPTMLKIQDGKVVQTYSGKDAIVDFEEAFIKTEE